MTIPEGWAATTLGELVQIISGTAPSLIKLDADGALPFVKVEDLNRERKYLKSSRTFTNSRLGLAPTGSVVFPKRGAAIMTNKVRLATVDLTMDTNLMALHAGESIENEFLYYLIQHEGLFKIADTSTIPQINNKHILPYAVLLPPIGEQRKIAEILTTWDDAIEKTSARIAKFELKFAGLMADLFTPSTDHRNLALSEFVTPVKTKNSAGETNVLTSSGKRGLVSQSEYYTKSVAGADISGYYKLEQGDFAYNRSASNGYPFGAIKRLERYTRGVLSTLYLCFRLDKTDEIDSDYLTHFFESGFLNRQLAAICQEGARSHGLLNVAQSDFFQLVVPVPDIERQRRIARTLNEAIAELELLERQRTTIHEQKRGLMQKLLTGEIRVSGEGATSSGEASIV